jgi:ribonuclease BN (tRNA processing enzyme)
MSAARHCVCAFLALVLLLRLTSNVLAQPSPPPLEVLVLGSGGPGATGRASSSYLVLVDGVARILVDAGSGSFVRLGEAQVALADLDLVLLTHLHIDHAGELPGMFKARVIASARPVVFDLWGPKGSPRRGQNAYFPSTSQLAQLLFGATGAFAYLSDFAAPMTIHAHDIAAPANEIVVHRLLEKGDLAITAVAGHHGDAPAVIYRIDHAGKSVTFSGDIDEKGLPALLRLAHATDLLVFHSVVLDPPGSPAILYTLHTPPRAIGQLARDAGVRQLLLSHLSPAVEQARDAVLQSIRKNYAGPIGLAKDGEHVRP